MTISRRSLNTLLAGLPMAAAWPHALAQSRKDSVVLGMVLEPPGLDPTIAPAAAIGEIVHYNVFEGLTKVGMDGSVSPLLAEDWSMTPDGKAYTFRLRKGVRFSDGAVFDASAVKFSFERAKAPGSTNKAKKAVFDNISSVSTPDAHTVILVLENAEAMLPFRLGENTAVILHPDSAASAATKPVGTGPFKLESWAKGSSAVSYTHLDVYKRQLETLADEHSTAMATQRRLSHDGFHSRLGRTTSRLCVENVGWNYPTAEALLDGWRHSPEHLRNLLDPKVRRMGLAARARYVTFFACS